MSVEKIRLNKFIAMCGTCSRREADRLIEQGRVRINGSIAIVGATVTENDFVMVDNIPVSPTKEKVVLAFNKPKGVTCSERDEHAEITINELIDYPQRVTYAGRLDKDSEGLILLTNDGDLINSMMRGANGHEKEYVVKVNGRLTKDICDKMKEGIYISELDRTTKPCRIFNIIYNSDNTTTFNIVLTEGLNRQIRRMCDFFDLKVIKLTRIRVLNIRLGKLATGSSRRITGDELNELYRLSGR